MPSINQENESSCLNLSPQFNGPESIFEKPRLFMAEHFCHLRNEIDLEFLALFSQSTSSFNLNLSIISTTHLLFINEINLFEKQCFDNFDCLQNEIFQQDRSDENTIIRLEKQMFQDRSILFLKEKHLLVCIDEWLGKQQLNKLKK